MANAPDSLIELSAATGRFVRALVGPEYALASTGTILDAANSMVAHGDRLWILSTDGPSVVELDARSGGSVRVIPDRNGDLQAASGFSVDASHVWILSVPDGRLTELGASSGRLVRTVNLRFDFNTSYDRPNNVVSDGAHVWVTEVADPNATEGNVDAILELSARTGALIREIDGSQYDLTDPGAMAVDGGYVWVANSGFCTDGYCPGYWITQLSATTGKFVRIIRDGGEPGEQAPPAILAAGPQVWVTNPAVNSVREVDAQTGAIMRVISEKSYGLNGPIALAFSGQHVWIANHFGSTVTEVHSPTGRLDHVISGSPYQLDAPGSIVAHGSNLWVLSGGGLWDPLESTCRHASLSIL